MTLRNCSRLSECLSVCPGYGLVHDFVQRIKALKWMLSGRPDPPPHGIKQRVLRDLAAKYALTTLVETGTHLGDMVYALRQSFSSIYSIELSANLHRQAKRRFENYNHINILCGNSGNVLRDLVPKLKETTLFWLDGHYSGGNTALGSEATPIHAEMAAIGSMTVPYVVAIDDARLFGFDPCYPTYDGLKVLAVKLGVQPETICIKSDIVIISRIE